MKTRTHRQLGRKAFPNMDPAVADIVNSILDNPPPWFGLLSRIARLPVTNYQGHRARGGHDVVTAIIAPFVAGVGLQGLTVVGLHLVLDAVRDHIVKKYGATRGDLAESVLNILIDVVMGEDGRKKRRKRRNISSLM